MVKMGRINEVRCRMYLWYLKRKMETTKDRYSLSAVNDVWLTCCALHNMLLNINGLDTKWNEGVKSPY